MGMYGSTCIPGDRWIEAASVVTLESIAEENPFRFVKRFCKVMCENPRLPAGPVCGNNNWYYAYGKNFDRHQVLPIAHSCRNLSRVYSAATSANAGPNRLQSREFTHSVS